MNLEAAVLGIIVGLIRKGRISNLSRIPFRGAYVFAVPLVMFLLAGVLTHYTNDPRLNMVAARAMNILLYVVLLTAIGANWHIRELRIMGVGTFMNFLGLTANGGMMPVSEWAARAAGMWSFLDPANGIKHARHVIMTPETRLKPLVDLIPIPIPHLSAVLSIGDILLAVGIFMLIMRFMCEPSPGAHIEKTN